MDQLKIETVEITNFRSIRKLQCSLSDISVFVGQNDVGKSNILKASEEGTSAEDASDGLDGELGSGATMSEAYKKLEAELKKIEKGKAELKELLES